tara:strand:+ start:12790 stop:14064 length:1275 start_codon:yes stop_codon:yes gene_type:complete
MKGILKKRKKILPSSLTLAYKRPLHIVRGNCQFLFDKNGRKYLDGINNIQHVGHSHPKISAAAYDQMQKLNTNTRYLDQHVVNYAENLLKTLPKKLSVCFFTNSGSESNDLALRLARAYTKSCDTIVLEGAYHGHTESLINISPYKYNGPGGFASPKYVYEIPIPDIKKGKYVGEDAEKKYFKSLSANVESIRFKGQKPIFIFESFMGCGGQLPLPKEFLTKGHDLVQKNGGLCIADEIQTGFGRLGKHFWGFEFFNIEPDIVTLGKSMGNGFPLSAVVTTEKIAKNFDNGMEYFNSFGGNPVSSVVGNTVLKIISEEGLQSNAEIVGQYLKKMLLELKQKSSLIGDVRGEGLFLGIEISDFENNQAPLPAIANKIINEMRAKCILLSVDGLKKNIIKIKPPLPFNKENADFLVGNLEKVIFSF